MTQDEQIILAVDDQGNFTGQYIPKSVGHTGVGQRHLAISVLLFNNQGQVLLQRRKHQIFDDIWDVTGATHPLHKEDGTDESIEDATWRCLEREYGISEKIPLKNYGFFNYFARYNPQKRRGGETDETHNAKYGDLCENEYCAILVGEYNGPLNLSDEVGYNYKWMDKQEFLKDIYQNTENYSPWAIEAVKILEKSDFFN